MQVNVVQIILRRAVSCRCLVLGDDALVEQMRGKLGERDGDVNIPRVQQRGPAPKLSAIPSATQELGRRDSGSVRDRGLQLSIVAKVMAIL